MSHIKRLLQKARRASSQISANRNQDYFVTKRHRPVRDAPRNHLWVPDYREDTAILLQGPLVRENDFTAETVRRYRTNFPKAPLIVSTWADESDIELELLDQMGAVVLTQQQPTSAGIKNSNLQMASAALGVHASASLGVSHVLKTRTDQRVYSERMLSILHNSVTNFPLHHKSGTQAQRLVGLSLNSFAYRMYGISDMFTFGATEDILRYWSGNLDHRELVEPIVAKNHREFSVQQVCEVKYCSDFLSETGWDLQWTLEDSWSAIASRFLVLDACAIDLYWPKYTNEEERWRTYDGSPRFQEIDFSFWLELFYGTNAPNEQFLDDPW